MLLSIPTLLLVAVFIFALMGLLTLHAWSRGVREQTLGYLGGMLLLAALGVTLISLRGIVYEFVALVLGNIVLLLAAALNWTSMRVFAGRAPHVPGIAAGALLWAAWGLTPSFYADLGQRVSLYSLLVSVYGGLSMFELWRVRQRLEVAYLPAMLLIVIHTAFYAVRALADHGLSLQHAIAGVGSGTGFFSFMLFESMLYAIGIAYVTLAMVRERTELKFKAAAYADPLTGIGNRRAFMAQGEQLLANCARRGQPVALLLCDLDHFKRLNDVYGHQTGDQALIAFSQVTRQSVRQEDVFGRIGGEEFACLLANTDEPTALRVAQRICNHFYQWPLLEPGLLSVSVGIVSSGNPAEHDLSRLLSMADSALYGAKHQGRNRVQLYQPPSESVPALPARSA
ncbi:GGDEF domain-containing protein [Pseudomonas rubra]|uniref:diguanylate cyclase n=1 Tax=Pseudomonas rubra TaxID=2942627 RepID=A0ABT5PFX9_9PSED|nr:GGDEF domain-containing protein [Pseudomonas rubra]MDD1017168.1 GGDEF domain-containing protein [Pseudomonas rubra]MDD1041215.1 GGDEF domain-containing protein [Pseudomonas rubra]MDD1158017.1 GGDEF domain-containing protein [Pseudomonas rubra]